MSAEDASQGIAVVEEIVDHPEIDPARIADETVEEDANEAAEHHDAIDDVEEPEESPAETSTEETLIDSRDDDDVAETAAEEIEDEEPAVSEMVSEAEHDGEETAAESVFADDAQEMDEFEAALTQDLMAADEQVESRADPDVSAADDVSDEFDDTHEDEPQVAEDRGPLSLEQPVEEERITLPKPRAHVINVSPAPTAEQTEKEETDSIMNYDDAPQPVAVRRPTRPVAKTRREPSEPVDTADVSRLMDEIDQQMAKPESNLAEMHWPICVLPLPQPSLTNHWAKMIRTAQRPIVMIWPRLCARAAQNHQERANLRHCVWSPNSALMNPQQRRPRLRHLRPSQSQKWPSMKHTKHKPNL